MLGSSQSIAGPNIALNTIMAEELSQFADVLENADDFETTLHELVCETLRDHQRIIFNGNGYSQEWKDEAAKRGLSNLPSTAKALPTYISQKNIDLVTKHGIFTETEFLARYEIHLQSYNKLINIEARTMVDMARNQILPAALKYTSELADGINRKRQAMGENAAVAAESSLVERLSATCDSLYTRCETLAEALKQVPANSKDAADYYSDVIIPQMEQIRTDADLLESFTAKSYWPYPVYSDMLFY